jgi:hypothetical protein
MPEPMCIMSKTCEIVTAAEVRIEMTNMVVTYIGKILYSGLSDDEIVKSMKKYYSSLSQ